MPRVLASLLIVVGVLGLAGTLVYQLSDEASAAIRGLPAASKRLRAVVERGMGPRPSVVQELQTAADSISKAAEGQTTRRRAGEPMAVEIVEPTIDVREYLWMGWWGLLGFGAADAADRVPVVLHAVVRRSLSPQVRAAGGREAVGSRA